MSGLLFTGAREVVTSVGARDVCVREGAAVLVRDGRVVAVGDEASLGDAAAGAERVDCGGQLITPGFVDSHTHAVFGGWRAGEYALRSRGVPYMEIARRGGGINASVRDVRGRSEDELAALLSERLDVLLRLGTTTVEVKSGYGLDTETELRQLRAVRRAQADSPLTIVPTFLGAHEFPPEYRDRRDDYVDVLVRESIPAVAAERLAVFCDVFMEPGVFTGAQARRVLEAGIRTVLAEKVLFQSVAAYREAVLLAAAVQADVRAHVPLRSVPVLQRLRDVTLGKPFTLTVEAGDRGLGCNGIHFLDLFQYLGGQPPVAVAADIDRPLQANRRDPALVEFTGTLTAGNAEGARLAIRFSPGHERLAVLNVETPDGRAIIDQAGPVESDIDGLAGPGFEMPMASRMAAGMLADIAGAASPLPDLAEGFETNRLMLAAYNRALTGRHADDLVCPIT